MGKLGKSDKTVRIPISQLKPNPDNPRKDLGDLTELTESIKKNGVMQNLTVMPDTDGKQAESFQLMLDLGDNVETIAEKVRVQSVHSPPPA